MAWQPPSGGSADEHWKSFQEFGATWPTQRGPPPAWHPTAAMLDSANLNWLMQEVGAGDVHSLHKWTARKRDEFWSLMLDRLEIPFDKEPDTIRTGGDEQPTWLPGARLNISQVCFRDQEVAIIAGGEGQETRTLSGADLQAWVGRVAGGLQAHGFVRGDAIGLYAPMNVECVVMYLAIVRAGMVAISIPDSFAAPEVATRLKLGNARALFTVASFQRGGKAVPMLPKAQEAADEVGGIRIICQGPGGDIAFDELEGESLDAVPCHPDAATNILFSSGTTGEPKAIPWTHLTPIKCIADGHLHQDIRSDDVVAWPTNIGWMMGPWLIYASLGNGATMALYEGVPTGPEYLAFLNDAQVTVLGLVPAIVRAWKSAGVAGEALPGIRVFSSTGEASNARDYLYLMGLAGYRAPIIEYCGGTEIGGGHLTGTVLQPQSPATFSTPAMGLDFVLFEDGERMEGPGMGELYLIPPSIGLSQRLLNRDHDSLYFEGAPELDGQRLRRHGDEVERLGAGYYRAQGRADDTMNLGGIKVGSIELETAMNGVEGVEETAAIAITPAGGGAEQLVVFAVGGGDNLQAQLQAAIKTKLNPLFRIHDVVVVESLPRTASNKVMRKELRKQYQE